MATAASAWAAIKARLLAVDAGISIPLYWPNERVPIPDTPTIFAFVAFEIMPSFPAPFSFGGGRFNNRYRNSAFATAYVFAPAEEGIEDALAHAETIAARLRSYRDDNISCFEATVEPGGPGSNIKPPGLSGEFGNYYYCIAEASLQFDQIG
jgi:hypothetical protein